MPEHNHGFEGQNRHPDRRIDTAAARKMLGMIGKNYDEEEISEILGLLYGIAEEGFEVYCDNSEPTEPEE